MSVDMQADPLIEDQLSTGDVSGDGLPRDGHGRYILPHPVSGERKGRTRVTTLAGMGDSGRGLVIDRERKVVAGMGYRPDLCARAAAAHSGLETDPNAKKLLSEIAEAAFIQAGGNAGANYGTAQHAVFEQFFLHGVPMENLAEYFHEDIKAVVKALEFHQLRILPQYIERVVYSILYDRGGKTDAIVEHIPTGDLYIFDLKTEDDPIRHPRGKTIQLSYYANADCMFNYQTGQWEPMPKVRTDVALIVHVRPGKGAETDITKAILTVPIDQGQFGVRAVEMMRAWHQQTLVIAPFMSSANWVPAPVNTNGDVAVANGVIPATTSNDVAPTTPQPVPATPNDVVPSMVCHVCAVDLNQAPHSSQCPLFTPPATSNGVSGDPDTLHNVAYPMAGINESVPPTTTPNGVHAQVSQIVDTAVTSGQQLSTSQVAELNKQTAQIVKNQATGLPPAPAEPPGRPVVGPGTGHTIYSGIHADADTNEKPEGVPDARPPAPKSMLGKLSAAEHLKQLLEVPPGGVDPEAEVLDLAQLPKPRLQELIHLASGQTISMDSADLKRHKKPLAEMLVEILNRQRDMSGRPPVGQPVHAAEVAASTNGVIDMTFEGVIKAIKTAVSPDQINNIYRQVIDTYGQGGWHPDFNSTATEKYTELTGATGN